MTVFSWITRSFAAILICASFILWSYDRKLNFVPAKRILTTEYYINGWQPIGHTYEEQIRLHDMSNTVVLQSETINDSVPTVPCISADGHLFVLSVAASRIRYGVSLTFIMVLPSIMKRVLSEESPSEPISANKLTLWCIFDDGSVTPAYSHDSIHANDGASILDCPLSSFASDQLWKYNQTLRVHLASTTDRDRNIPILKAFVNVPSSNSTDEQLTLCTSPLQNKDKFLIQWIEFHRLVGFRKFVIYNTTDTNNRLSSVLDAYIDEHPNLVDVIQWNFSSLGIQDLNSSRYFQTEAIHDCLIRYGDQSEWLGMFDLDEYIVPFPPYETVVDYLHDHFGRRQIGSVNLWSLFYCTKNIDEYLPEEEDLNHLTIERFVVRAPKLYRRGHQKYLYRPRFVQYLTIHYQIFGLPMKQTAENFMALAHYPSMTTLRRVPGCQPDEYVNDTRIRDRFAHRIRKDDYASK